jgi:hypothetical protein
LPKDSCRIKHAAVTLESSWVGESFVEGNRYPDDLFQRASDYYTRIARAEAQRPDPLPPRIETPAACAKALEMIFIEDPVHTPPRFGTRR